MKKSTTLSFMILLSNLFNNRNTLLHNILSLIRNTWNASLNFSRWSIHCRCLSCKFSNKFCWRWCILSYFIFYTELVQPDAGLVGNSIIFNEFLFLIIIFLCNKCICLYNKLIKLFCLPMLPIMIAYIISNLHFYQTLSSRNIILAKLN